MIPDCVPVRNTIPHAMAKTTIVRIAVARLELTPSIPIFANMEVSAAKTADKRANTNHTAISPYHSGYFPTLTSFSVTSMMAKDMIISRTESAETVGS